MNITSTKYNPVNGITSPWWHCPHCQALNRKNTSRDWMKFKLPARKPFNFTSVVNSHGWRQLTPFSYDEDDNTLCYILQLSNERVIELKMRDGKDAVIVETEKLDRAEQKEVKYKIDWMFGLD